MRLTPSPEERRPDPPPLATNDSKPVLVGTVVWAVLFVAALLVRGRLVDAGHGWWVWVPLAGFLLGLLGLWFLRGRQRRMDARAAAAAKEAVQPNASSSSTSPT